MQIALLTIARKFIILDATKVERLTIIGLAAAVLTLGALRWPVRDQDRKEDQARIASEGPSTSAKMKSRAR